MQRHVERYGIDFLKAYERARELRIPDPRTGHVVDPMAEHYPVVVSSDEGTVTCWNVCWMEGCND